MQDELLPTYILKTRRVEDAAYRLCVCILFVRCAIAAASINDGYFFEAACDKKMFRLSFAQKYS